VSPAIDLIVIGSGVNGLTTAARVARAGRSVLVLERRAVAGGLAAAEEFHPGYRSPGFFQDTGGLRPAVVSGLGLVGHGLEMRSEPAPILALGGKGGAILLHADPDRAAPEIAAHSAADASRYAGFRAFLAGIRPLLADFIDRPPLNLIEIDSESPWELMRRGLGIRRLGAKRMMELLRLPPMAVADWLGEWFECGLLKAALALPSVAGAYMGPRSPQSAMNLLLHEGAAGPGVVGGSQALAAALEKCAGASGARIRTGARVERLLVGSKGVEGVRLAGGEEIRAAGVAAACDPKQLFLDLLPTGALPGRVIEKIRAFRTRGTTAQVLLAMSRPLRFAARQEVPVELARIGRDLDHLEKAFDAVKYRRWSEDPVLEVQAASAVSGRLAPAGHDAVSILVHHAPYDLEGGWDAETAERLAELVLSRLEEHAPGIRSAVVARAVRSPADLEALYGLTGGHVHHGEYALDQLLVRPIPECVGYRSPLAGLHLCGSGSHPGGGLTCAPGWLAAAEILRTGRP